MSRISPLFWLTLIATISCQRVEPTAITSTVPLTQSATPSAPTVTLPSATPSPTFSPSSTLLNTPLSTVTGNLTPALTPEIMPTPLFLVERTPSLAQLEAYLRQATIRIFNNSENGQYESFTWDETRTERFFLHEQTQFYYLDVNADEEDDLLLLFAEPFLWGLNYLIVMLWQGDQYGQPLAIFDGTKLPGGVHFTLEDWTGDGNPEIVWDTEIVTSGTGFVESTRIRYLLQCLSECNVVWSYTTTVDWDSNSFYHGRGVRAADVLLNAAKSEIVVIEEEFRLPFIAGGISSPMEIFTTTKAIYLWTGAAFELTKTEILTPAQTITSTQKLTAKSSVDIAAIEFVHFPADPGNDQYFEGFSCTVMVSGQVIEYEFACNPAFTQIEWHDVTADGRAEIVVTTLADTKSFIYIWQQEELGYRLIADIQGDIIRAQLYGTRLENVAEDQAYQILAREWGKGTDLFCFSYMDPGGNDVPKCWFELTRRDRIYIWDGWQFVALDGLP